MSYLGTRNAVSIGVPQHMTLGGSNLLDTLSPSLLLQFAGAETLDSRVTFTRSTTATFTGSNGLIQSAAINAPRFTYNPTTLESLGLLIEEQRVNSLTRSQEMSTSPWTAAPQGTATVPTNTANAGVSPNGTTTASRWVFQLNGGTATGDIAIVRQTFTPVAGTSYTYSVWIKSFDGASSYNAQIIGADGAGSAVAITGTWTRFTVTATGVASAISFGVRLRGGQSPTNSNAADILVWGAQLEAGAFATSYIPTVASQVTRAADVASMTGTNFSSWYNAVEGTIYTENATSFVPPAAAAFIASINNGTGNEEIRTRYVNGAIACQISAGAVQNVSLTLAATSNTQYKTSFSYATNDAAAAVNGALLGTDTSVTVPTVDRLAIGVNSATTGAFLNGTIKKIVYYPRRLTNGELQAITS
jgi:hypothetical protein